MAGAGIGEAMLLSAVVGGGSAAVTGGDPLKGALLGGLTGGIGAGITPALGGMFGGAEAAGLAAAAEAAPAAMTSMATAPATASTLGLTANAANAAPLVQSAMPYSPGLNFLDTPGVTNLGSSFTGTGFGELGSGTAGLANFSNNGIVDLTLPNAASAIPNTGSPPSFMEGLGKIAKDPTEYIKDNKYKLGASALAGAIGGREDPKGPEEYNGPLKRFRFNPETYRPAFAEGGITNLATGGISDLGGYSDYARGGRMLKGPGDGMSDSIPASIAGRRPARLANEEFVVPADVVSHLGNGSSDAGAKQLYAMMDRVRKARTGRKSQGREINPRKYMFA